MTKKFRQFLKDKQNRNRERLRTGQSSKRHVTRTNKEDTKNDEKDPIACFRCGRPGHIRSECPNRGQTRDKAMKVTWSDLNSDEEEQAYMAHADDEETAEESDSESEVCDSLLLNMTKEDIVTAFVDLADNFYKIRRKHKQLKLKCQNINGELKTLKEKLCIADKHVCKVN
ncbi:hypothetical protein LINPERHAP2_LOCUS39245 [Linum perenne]